MKNIQYKKIFCGMMIVLGLMIVPDVARAETVNASLSITVNDVSNPATYEGLGLKEIFFDHINETINVYLKKNINIVNQNNLNLNKVDVVGVGETLNINTSSTYGNWTIGGEQQNLGTYNHYSDRTSWIKSSAGQNMYSKVFIPDNDNNVLVSSNNPNVISCSSSVCTTKQNGVADITISFPNKTHVGSDNDRIVIFSWGEREYSYEVSTKGNLFFGPNNGFEDIKIGAYGDRSTTGASRKDTSNLKNMTYTFPSVTYSITVGETAGLPNILCSSPSNVTSNSATINWNYSGTNPQTLYQVQLSKSPSFASEDIEFNASSPSSNTSHTFDRLATSTTYYSRIQVTDSQNNVSEWKECASFTTTNGDIGGSSFYCSANPLQVVSGQNTTFTAYPSGGTYKWNNNSSLTQNPYTTQLELGINTMNVEIEKDGKTESATCVARVCDGPRPEDEACSPGQDTYRKYSTINTCDENGVWQYRDVSCSDDDDDDNDDEKSNKIEASFYFKPDIADQSNQCQLEIQANNVSSCYLENRLYRSVGNWAARDGRINISQRLNVGTYQLYCTGTQEGATPTKIGIPKACYSNPDIRED